jgi:2-polyprenyl-3-methyl-5-hydroxy-6-metoxy-1,4-benzoquinol methylase
MLKTVVLQPSKLAPFGSAYRRMMLALVGDPASMPAAVLVQRWSKVPWIAVLDAETLRELNRSPRSIAARAVGQAAAVLIDPSCEEEIRRLLGGRRIVLFGDPARLARVVSDAALAPGARSELGGPSALLADAWVFLNERATRLAIRAMPLTRKAAEPIHPHHLIGGSWHLWYLKHLRAGDRVLDVGCANGAQTLAAARVVRSIVGVDIDARELVRAERRAGDEGIQNVEFKLLDLAEPSALEGLGHTNFDAILALDVLEHLANRTEVLHRLRALLQPSGRLIISVPNRETPYRRFLRKAGAFAFSDPDHKVEYTDKSLESELLESGFKISRRERGGYDSPIAGLSTLLGVASLRAYKRLAEHRYHLSQRFPERATALRVVAMPLE